MSIETFYNTNLGKKSILPNVVVVQYFHQNYLKEKIDQIYFRLSSQSTAVSHVSCVILMLNAYCTLVAMHVYCNECMDKMGN